MLIFFLYSALGSSEYDETIAKLKRYEEYGKTLQAERVETRKKDFSTMIDESNDFTRHDELVANVRASFDDADVKHTTRREKEDQLADLALEVAIAGIDL